MTAREYEVYSRLERELLAEQKNAPTPECRAYWDAYRSGMNRAFYELGKKGSEEAK